MSTSSDGAPSPALRSDQSPTIASAPAAVQLPDAGRRAL